MESVTVSADALIDHRHRKNTRTLQAGTRAFFENHGSDSNPTRKDETIIQAVETKLGITKKHIELDT